MSKAKSKAKRKAPTRGLSCHTCGSPRVIVSDKQQQVRRDGRTRLAAGVRCGGACKREWWSTHPDALAAARAMDAEAKA